MKPHYILAIDPGPKESAFVVYDPKEKELHTMGKHSNEKILEHLGYCVSNFTFVIEMVACFGMTVGASVFDTVFWIGRFWQAVDAERHKLYRREVKMHLCGSMRAKDKNIRQALIDKFPATGGGKVPQIGTKKEPGPLFGISGDMWSALAVAVTWAETKMGGEGDAESSNGDETQEQAEAVPAQE